MDQILEYLPRLSFYMSTLPLFATWFSVCAMCLAVAGIVYTFVTPKRELQMIREGNVCVSVAFSGFLIGYAIMLASVMMGAASRVDLVLWAVVGLFVQLGAYAVAALILGNVRLRYENNDIAAGIFVGGLSIAVGIINAATMVY